MLLLVRRTACGQTEHSSDRALEVGDSAVDLLYLQALPL